METIYTSAHFIHHTITVSKEAFNASCIFKYPCTKTGKH